MKENKQINDLDGLIIIDKPKNYTSNDCLSIIKKYLHPRKIGHTGTLDENATGVLVCLLGNSTKCQEYLMKTGDKIYEAELILGLSTDTEDITGNAIELCEEKTNSISQKEIEEAAKKFVGTYKQIPPMYSAKKVGGKKLLNLARKGIVVDRKPCNVEIKSIIVTNIESYIYKNNKLKKVKIFVSCSKGTYIRTLCKDIGQKLKIPACMGDLRRIATGNFKISDSITIDDLKQKIDNDDFSFIRPCYYQPNDSIITFGKFETLHIGHMKLLKTLVEDAKQKHMKSIVLIVGNNDDSIILTKEQRISKLKYIGIDIIYNFKLTNSNKKINPVVFVEEILINQLKAKEIVVGSDCSFGYNKEGNIDLLLSLCKKNNIGLKKIEKIYVEGTEDFVSSTLIKSEYKKGNIQLVNKLLGK